MPFIPRLWIWRILYAVTITLAAYLTTPMTTQNDGAAYDGVFYMAAAFPENAAPLYRHYPPWCWRVLTPFLAGLFPADWGAHSFLIISALSFCISLLLIFDVLRRFGISEPAAYVVISIYAGVFWTAQSVFYFPVMVDQGAQCFVFWILSLMLRREYSILPWVFAVAAAQKESVILLAPVVAAFRLTQGERRETCAVYLTILLAAVLVPYGVLRSLISPAVPYNPEGVLRLMFFRQGLDPAYWPSFLVAVFSGLGVFPLLLLCFPRATWDYMRRNYFMLVHVAIGIVFLFGGNDKARLFLHMMPPIMITAGFLLDRHIIPNRASAWLTSIIVLNWACNFMFHGQQDLDVFMHWASPGFSTEHLDLSLLRLAALVGIWAALWKAFKPARPQREGN